MSRSSRLLRPLGRVVVGVPFRSVRSNGLDLIGTPYVWEPSGEIASMMPDGFRIELESWQIPDDSFRRFVPRDLGTLLIQASLAGRAILSAGKTTSPRDRNNANRARLLFQAGPGFREFLGRNFRRQVDLQVSGERRLKPHPYGILPEHLGVDANGAGQRWSISRLMEEGRNALTAGSTNAVDEESCIQRGLFQAAKINPISPQSLKKREAQALIRMALFDGGKRPAKIAAELRQRILMRLDASLDQHLDDDVESFRCWFFENLDNIVHQVSKRKTDGGPIDRDLVRQCILDFVFDAYVAVARCVDAFMKDFAAALHQPLSSKERMFFRANYCARNCLGGFSLAFLQVRFSFLREAVLDIFHHFEDRTHWGVLLRLLDFYSAMATNKRKSDAEYKNRKKHQTRTGRTSRQESINLKRAAGLPCSKDVFQLVAQEVRERRNLTCACGSFLNWTATIHRDGISADNVVYTDQCTCMDSPMTLTVPIDEFRRIMRQVQGLE